MQEAFYYVRTSVSVLELCTQELAVQTCNVRNSDVLRTFHFTCTGVGTCTETELVHLCNHCLRTLGTLDLTLRKKRERTYTG